MNPEQGRHGQSDIDLQGWEGWLYHDPASGDREESGLRRADDPLHQTDDTPDRSR
ncbi:hypothetical protein GCM10010388_49450 [Streptomyces mauvecolor]|uniref:hypothetical protein n=1 Tax=Streptomyces mauvecolor TaxID=58345 RepID=UPI0031CE24D9